MQDALGKQQLTSLMQRLLFEVAGSGEFAECCLNSWQSDPDSEMRMRVLDERHIKGRFRLGIDEFEGHLTRWKKDDEQTEAVRKFLSSSHHSH